MAKKITSMQELSSHIGLSRATLSKYFNAPCSLKASTKEKIEKALANVDYTPNLHARNLVSSQSNLLGVLMPTLSDSFYAQILRNLEIHARKYGRFPIIQCSHGIAKDEARAVQIFKSLRVSAVIICPCVYDQNTQLFTELEKEMPVLYLDNHPDKECSYITSDYTQTVSMMTEYLISQNKQPIYLGLPEMIINAKERQLAYEDRMNAHQLTPHVIRIKNHTAWDFELQASIKINELLKKQKLTPNHVILCGNDRMAIGALYALRENGYIPGKDIFVAGHDDQIFAEYLFPPLTTIRQDVLKIGQLAFDTIVRLQEEFQKNKTINYTKISIPGNLIIRQSV